MKWDRYTVKSERKGSTPVRYVKPTLEVLEDRTVPAVLFLGAPPADCEPAILSGYNTDDSLPSEMASWFDDTQATEFLDSSGSCPGVGEGLSDGGDTGDWVDDRGDPSVGDLSDPFLWEFVTDQEYGWGGVDEFGEDFVQEGEPAEVFYSWVGDDGVYADPGLGAAERGGPEDGDAPALWLDDADFVRGHVGDLAMYSFAAHSADWEASSDPVILNSMGGAMTLATEQTEVDAQQSLGISSGVSVRSESGRYADGSEVGVFLSLNGRGHVTSLADPVGSHVGFTGHFTSVPNTAMTYSGADDSRNGNGDQGFWGPFGGMGTFEARDAMTLEDDVTSILEPVTFGPTGLVSLTATP